MKLLSRLLLATLALATAAAAAVFQCPMHPWIKSDHAGAKCTICGMALVAPAAGAADAAADPNLVTLTPAQAAVTGVQTSAIRRAPLVRTLRVTGVIDDDETRHRILAARVPGRIEQLHVNYVGADVREGEPLATVYSPEILTAQRTYLERLRAGTTAFTASERASAREHLLELGLTDEEIRILEGTQQPTAMLNVRAPMSGTVVSRSVYEGQYVQTNDRLFEIGDFSRMWFVFDAYEPDLAWLRTGQPVEITVASLPGRVLAAPVSFIDPNLNETTRTARVRVVLDNAERLLRHSQTATGVVRLESPAALLVPRRAVLQHRGSAVVFVAREGQAYAAREIRLGRIGDEDAEVLAGLAEGDRVVTEGALLLDGQAQLAHAAVDAAGIGNATAPSPAAQPAGAPGPDAAAKQHLRDLALAAADAAAALAADDLPAYQRLLPALRAGAGSYVAAFAPAGRTPALGVSHGTLGDLGQKLVDGPDLDAARRAFEPFSTAVADLVRPARAEIGAELRIYECPMTPVLGRGRWLSRTGELRNPFFGSAMPECGEEVK